MIFWMSSGIVDLVVVMRLRVFWVFVLFIWWVVLRMRSWVIFILENDLVIFLWMDWCFVSGWLKVLWLEVCL